MNTTYFANKNAEFKQNFAIFCGHFISKIIHAVHFKCTHSTSNCCTENTHKYTHINFAKQSPYLRRRKAFGAKTFRTISQIVLCTTQWQMMRNPLAKLAWLTEKYNTCLTILSSKYKEYHLEMHEKVTTLLFYKKLSGLKPAWEAGFFNFDKQYGQGSLQKVCFYNALK